MLNNIEEERIYLLMIWWCRPWFGSAWSHWKRSSLSRPSLVPDT